jgi:hypothetical protein
MTAETLLPIIAGFILIIGAMVLAFRQSMSMIHFLVLALGAVLVGVSGVQLQFDGNGLSASIGQLKAASADTSAATQELAAANKELGMEIAALNERVNQLQAQLKPGTPRPTTWNPAMFSRHLESSQRLTDRAKEAIGNVRVP